MMDRSTFITDICEMNVEQRYGDGVIKTLSQDLRMKIPEVTGLTPGGLYYCKRFYLLYNKVFEIFPQLGEKSVPQLGEIFKESLNEDNPVVLFLKTNQDFLI